MKPKRQTLPRSARSASEGSKLETARSAKRREQPPPSLRSTDFPIHPPGGTDYVLKGIPPDIKQQFEQACLDGLGTKGTPRSMRWVLLSLMQAYAKGQVQL